MPNFKIVNHQSKRGKITSFKKEKRKNSYLRSGEIKLKGRKTQSRKKEG